MSGALLADPGGKTMAVMSAPDKPTDADAPAPENPWPARLKAIRDRHGLTQEEAAARINAPLGTWRGWEQGRRRPNPMIQRLIELAFPDG